MNEEKQLKAIENDARFDLNDLAKELDTDVEKKGNLWLSYNYQL